MAFGDESKVQIAVEFILLCAMSNGVVPLPLLLLKLLVTFSYDMYDVRSMKKGVTWEPF